MCTWLVEDRDPGAFGTPFEDLVYISKRLPTLPEVIWRVFLGSLVLLIAWISGRKLLRWYCSSRGSQTAPSVQSVVVPVKDKGVHK